MKFFTKIAYVRCALLFFVCSLTYSPVSCKQMPIRSKNTFLKSFSKEKAPETTESETALSREEIAALFDAFSSTEDNAGANAITLLTSIADKRSNLTWAFYYIINGLLTIDGDHGETMPLDRITPAVKTALATTNIPSIHGTNSLLHYAALFDIIAPVIDESIDAKSYAAAVITILLSDLTQDQLLTAVTAKDQWNSTPLHYAAFTDDETGAVMNALCKRFTQSRLKNLAISVKNKWGYTPVHHAATAYYSAIIDPLFLVLTPSQKRNALTALDQWNTTPLHYAALFSTSAIIDPLFLTSFTGAQLTEAVTRKNIWNSSVMHYAAMASNSSIIDPLFSKMTPDQKIDAITAKNKWGYSPLELSKLSIIQDEAGYWIRSDITNTFIDAMVPTPYLEYGTIALPSILGY